MSKTVGVISDTHGLVRPEALAALAGSDLLIHAGDVGAPHVLDALGRLAPVRAVVGNVDGSPLAERLPTALDLELDGVRIHVLHEITKLARDPRAAGFAVVVFGHSHRPTIERREGVLYLNPGSGGPRRLKLPVAVARLHLGGPRVRAEVIELEV